MRDISFSTWSRHKKKEKFLTDVGVIFKPHLAILEGNIKGKGIEISCVQSDPSYNYCGGELYFTVESAEVRDENGKEYSIKELDEICKSYWDEWERGKPVD